MPAVSVILPVYNAARSVRRAIESVLDQTLSDIEVIVVDDGSGDETVAVVSGIRDARLKLVQQEHGGVVRAANYATQLATAAVIARMDADDFAYPQRLEQQFALLERHKLDVVGSQVRILDQAGESVESMRRYERWINEETLDSGQILALRFVEFPLVNPTILARRKYFELGFRDGDFPEDYDLMLRAAHRGMRFAKVPEILLDWTDHANGLTRSDRRYRPEAFTACCRRHMLNGPLDAATIVDLWGVGKTGKPWLRWLQEQSITVRRAYDIDDRKVNARIHGVDIFHPHQLLPSDGTPIIIAVGAANARATIAPQLKRRGYRVGSDAWFVA